MAYMGIFLMQKRVHRDFKEGPNLLSVPAQ